MKRESELKGIEKVAVLLMSLGPDLSSKILKGFTETEIERITMEIANTTSVSADTISLVVDEFSLLSEARQYMLDGGITYAREILEKTLGTQKANIIIKKLQENSQIKPFDFVRKADPRQLANIIGSEHPQTIALIMSYLNSEQAAVVLSVLPSDMQPDIARRIAVMERTSPEILKEVENVLETRLSALVGQDYTLAGGIPSLVDILNQVDRSTEKLILEELEMQNAELVDEIRKRMFVFEDIVGLDDSSIQRVIREVDTKDLALALKGVNEDVSVRIFKNISKRGAEMLKEDIEFMGPVRLREVEEAQQRIVAVIRRLDESREIIISRGGEDVVIE
ncbi:flagellar motor switch protein FliG [Candidatus Contubernalis alkalaceticus]|uniref:flagellar motor switch protein FliG n=1 Tax=Candidatus Contubernalis alkaliaceticus TaxID=338645 RepID=UPI002A4E2DBC|nr:flagellar motor switch protein FliG [Candidatus Contubernalis alkalaceticus]UNC91744.1 flagellar motor switch protein FliG [Candidatus Contubernalis alkalaceticus]